MCSSHWFAYPVSCIRHKQFTPMHELNRMHKKNEWSVLIMTMLAGLTASCWCKHVVSLALIPRHNSTLSFFADIWHQNNLHSGIWRGYLQHFTVSNCWFQHVECVRLTPASLCELQKISNRCIFDLRWPGLARYNRSCKGLLIIWLSNDLWRISDGCIQVLLPLNKMCSQPWERPTTIVRVWRSHNYWSVWLLLLIHLAAMLMDHASKLFNTILNLLYTVMHSISHDRPMFVCWLLMKVFQLMAALLNSV